MTKLLEAAQAVLDKFQEGAVSEIDTLRAAIAEELAQTQVEPVGHLHSNGSFCLDRNPTVPAGGSWPVDLYLRPARTPLTDADGDAFRLAASKRFGITHFAPRETSEITTVPPDNVLWGTVEIWREDDEDPIHTEWYRAGSNMVEVTRGAINKAAAIEAAQGTTPAPTGAPAWKDAPDAPGLWVSCDKDDASGTWFLIGAEDVGLAAWRDGSRYYGPLPEDVK